jgi:hypothetical protein
MYLLNCVIKKIYKIVLKDYYVKRLLGPQKMQYLCYFTSISGRGDRAVHRLRED